MDHTRADRGRSGFDASSGSEPVPRDAPQLPPHLAHDPAAAALLAKLHGDDSNADVVDAIIGSHVRSFPRDETLALSGTELTDFWRRYREYRSYDYFLSAPTSTASFRFYGTCD